MSPRRVKETPAYVYGGHPRLPQDIASPWSPYGLQGDPVFQEPLSSHTGERVDRPATLFVGRDEEVLVLGRQIVGAFSSRAIVEGGPGVGKTSFVNRLKATLAASHRRGTMVPVACRRRHATAGEPARGTLGTGGCHCVRSHGRTQLLLPHRRQHRYRARVTVTVHSLPLGMRPRARPSLISRLSRPLCPCS